MAAFLPALLFVFVCAFASLVPATTRESANANPHTSFFIVVVLRTIKIVHDHRLKGK
jgi:hypothetical protein